MIRVKYNSNTGQILGNYPPNINYPSLTIDEDNKTITDQLGTFPYIEITKEQHEDGMGKNMVVIDGNYQEYVKTSAELLQEAKNKKIAELEAFHESDEVRILIINDTFQISTKYEQTRKWFNEIIHDLENKIKITGQSPNEITFKWQIQHKTWLPIKLSDLQLVKCKIFDITSVNYQQKISHLEAIEELNTIEKIESYDFKKGYLLNNKLNFDI
jgi:nitrate reductase NapAB chaperone NapD